MTDPILTDPLTPDEPNPAPQAPPVIEPPRRIVRRGGTPLLLTLFLFAALAFGLAYAWTNPKPQGGNEAIDTLTSQLEAQTRAQAELTTQVQSAGQAVTQQIQALQARLDKLENIPAPQGAPPAVTPPDTADITRRLDDLTARIDSLASRPAPAPVPAPAPAADSDMAAKLDQLQAAEKSALDAVSGRVDRLEQGAGRVESEVDRAARLSRVQQATAALQAGTPLGPLPDAPPALARFATAAPPTEAALKEAFPAIADQARAASRPEQAKTSLLERALARVEQSVTVRRGDHVIVGDPAAGVLSRAQDDVRNGDLAGAIHALAALQGPAAAAVQSWVADAQALLDARAALAALAARP